MFEAVERTDNDPYSAKSLNTKIVKQWCIKENLFDQSWGIDFPSILISCESGPDLVGEVTLNLLTQSKSKT